MTNLRNYFNQSYNIIFILLTLLLLILFILKSKNIRKLSLILIITATITLTIAFLIPIIPLIFKNYIIKIFITPILKKIKMSIILESSILIIIGLILWLLPPKEKKPSS